MQNAGLGTILAMRVFGDYPTATVPPAIYTFGCVLTGTILARFWAEFFSQHGVTM
jgi:BASS family bile acid:Na+ symporter